MGSESAALHILLFPIMAQGHLLPMIDMANLFASRGVKTTILTTPANAPLIQPSINRANSSSHQYPIHLSFIPFPSSTGLPHGCENLSSVPPHLFPNFFDALSQLREPFSAALRDLRPHCVISGMFFPWTYDVAAELGIPRIAFHGSNFFSRCAMDCVVRYDVLRSDPGSPTVVLSGLPHRIEMLRQVVPDFKVAIPFLAELQDQMQESEQKSYGVIVNSFCELEPDYAHYFRTVMARRAWHVGPMLLCNGDSADMSSRGSAAAGLDNSKCLRWLDEQERGSVLYACFGSASEFSVPQMRRIAQGLEESGHSFIWGARKVSDEAIPEGFEERVKGRGMVIRGWAPQVTILNHAAVGGFLTHCGWNSTLEGVCAGLPLVTWPLFAEQFYNERLIVEVLKVGVAVGAATMSMRAEERPLIEPAAIAGAIDKLMRGGEEEDERRRRAKELGVLARKAVDVGGSSYVDVANLIEELTNVRNRAVQVSYRASLVRTD